MPSKRRSQAKGPKGSFSPLVLVLVACGSLLVLLVVGLLVAKSMIDGWLRGDGFRDWLAKRSEQVLRSEVTVSELEWKGSEVYSKRITALGREDAGFSELALDGVRARAGGIADRAVRVPEVSINRLDLRFSPERPGGRAPAGRASGAADPTPAEAGPGLPAWLAKYLPERVEIDQVEVATARVAVESGAGPVFLLSGTRAVLQPDFRNGFLGVEGRGGRIAFPGRPEVSLKELALRWKGEHLFLDRAALGVFKKGHLGGRGEIGFGEAGTLDLDLDYSGIDIDEVVPPEWTERLAGGLGGTVRVTGPPSDPILEGTLKIDDGVVQSLPVLKEIARYTRSDRFERLVLSQAHADFRRSGDLVELRRIVLQSDGLVRVEGSLDIDGEILDGNFQVGVTPGTLRWIPGAERGVFAEERDGFLWTPMKLAGSKDAPKEDLSGRLLLAAGEAIVKDLPGGVLEAAKELMGPENAKGRAGDLIDQGKRALEGLAPFLKVP
jgi:hypothetical protein